MPLAACAVLASAWGQSLGWALLIVVIAALIAAVLVSVHHAEVIALRVGEPFGTLVLALAATIIEASLIVALMLSGGDAAAALARDAVFATVMIICNGVVGLCLLLGALRYRVLVFKVEGTTPALSVLATLVTLTLVLPTFTSTIPGPVLSPLQLVFAGIVSLALYAVFVGVQTVLHREHFLPVEAVSGVVHENQPPLSAVFASLALLITTITLSRGQATVLHGAVHLVLFAAFLFLAIVP